MEIGWEGRDKVVDYSNPTPFPIWNIQKLHKVAIKKFAYVKFPSSVVNGKFLNE